MRAAAPVPPGPAMRWRLGLLLALVALMVLAAGCAAPPTGTDGAEAGATQAGCPRAVTRADLLGTWHGWLDERRLELTLWPHPEHPIGLQGQAQQLIDGLPRITRVAGDLDHGAMVLEESLDGYQISGDWEGQVSAQPDPVGCLLVVRGTWHERPGSRSAPFTLQRPLR